jgi:hypothetical protein
VNPIMKEEYFRMLKEVREKYNIPDELVYGVDEIGIQLGIGVTEQVIGPAGAKDTTSAAERHTRKYHSLTNYLRRWYFPHAHGHLQRGGISDEVAPGKSIGCEVLFSYTLESFKLSSLVEWDTRDYIT